jgi:hypothetical protein
LRLESPELQHHSGEAINVVKAETLMCAIKCLKKPVPSERLAAAIEERNIIGKQMVVLPILETKVLSDNYNAKTHSKNHRVCHRAMRLVLQGCKRKVAAGRLRVSLISNFVLLRLCRDLAGD